MILNEPDRTPWDVRFRLFGVDVRIHPFFWLFMLLLSNGGPPLGVLVWLVAVVLSLLIHEFGHVAAFRLYGIRSYIVLHAFGGLAIPYGSGYGGSFGPRLAPGPSAFVAFAGPAAELLAAAMVVAMVAAAGAEVFFPFGGLFSFLPAIGPLGLSPLFDLLISDFVYVSIFWALLNLLPIIPLDGGRISQALFQRIDPQTGLKQALVLSMITAGFVAAFMLVKLGSWWNAGLFAFLAFQNFQTFQAPGYGSRRW